MSLIPEEVEFLELASGVRRVRTPEGADFYGLPIGAPITPDVIAAKRAEATSKGLPVPKGALTKGGQSQYKGQSSPAGGADGGDSGGTQADPHTVTQMPSTISGPKKFAVGSSDYYAPTGSILIRPKNNKNLAYVKTPDGKIHAFNEQDEVEIPPALQTIFAAKFNKAFKGDDNYDVDEFENGEGKGLSDLPEGAELKDADGVTQFKKMANGDWENPELGAIVSEGDIQELYDSGELTAPDTANAIPEEDFPDFKSMSKEDFAEAIAGLPSGFKMYVGNIPVSKNEDDTWTNDDSGKQLLSGISYSLRGSLKPSGPSSVEDKYEQDVKSAEAKGEEPPKMPKSLETDQPAPPKAEDKVEGIPSPETKKTSPKTKPGKKRGEDGLVGQHIDNVKPKTETKEYTQYEKGDKVPTESFLDPQWYKAQAVGTKLNVPGTGIVEKTNSKFGYWQSSGGYGSTPTDLINGVKLWQKQKDAQAKKKAEKDAEAAPERPKAEPLDLEKVLTPDDISEKKPGAQVVFEDNEVGFKFVLTKLGDGKWKLASEKATLTFDEDMVRKDASTGSAKNYQFTSKDFDNLPEGEQVVVTGLDGSQRMFTKAADNKIVDEDGQEYDSDSLHSDIEDGMVSPFMSPIAGAADDKRAKEIEDLVKTEAQASEPVEGALTTLDDLVPGDEVQVDEVVFKMLPDGTLEDKSLSDGPYWEKSHFQKYVDAGTIKKVESSDAPEETPEPAAEEPKADATVSLDGLEISEADVQGAIDGLEGHSGFQIAYGLKTVDDNNAVKKNIDVIKEKAKAANPDLAPKKAVLKYLKDSLNGETEELAYWEDELLNSGKPETEKKSSAKILIGSKDPKEKKGFGVTGGEFTIEEIDDAIEILQGYEGKLFKNELNKQNNPLGKLSPNDIVGFNKDKTITKKNFLDLLKKKSAEIHKGKSGSSDKDAAEESEDSLPNAFYMTPEEFDALPIGTQFVFSGSATWTKTEDDIWTAGSDSEFMYENSDWHEDLGSDTPIQFTKVPGLKTTAVPAGEKTEPEASVEDEELEEEITGPIVPGVGELVTTQNFETLPVGTTVQYDNGGPHAFDAWTAVKQPDGSFVDPEDGENLGNLYSTVQMTEWVTVKSLPEPVKSDFKVGDTLNSTEDFNALEEGTEIGSLTNENVLWKKTKNGLWLWKDDDESEAQELQPSFMNSGNAYLKSLPPVTHGVLGDDGVNKIGGQAGSNSGGLYTLPMSDGSESKYYVKKADTDAHGNNEALANKMYAELGVKVPEVDYNSSDKHIYSKIVDGKHDMSTRIAENDTEWLDKVRRDFAIDAWLSNRDVFGMSYDNILTDEEGTPWRIDNGGSLLFRAMGEKKTDFGDEVTELDIFRTGKKSKIYGGAMTSEQEKDGANRILAMSPDRIREMVEESNLPSSLADTLIARREYIAKYYGLDLPEDASKAEADIPSDNPARASEIGQTLTQKQFDSIKPGEQIGYTHFASTDKDFYTKQEDGTWKSHSYPHNLPLEDKNFESALNSNMLSYEGVDPKYVKPGEKKEIKHGDELDFESFKTLGVGDSVTNHGPEDYGDAAAVYTKKDDGQWESKQSQASFPEIAFANVFESGKWKYGDSTESPTPEKVGTVSASGEVTAQDITTAKPGDKIWATYDSDKKLYELQSLGEVWKQVDGKKTVSTSSILSGMESGFLKIEKYGLGIEEKRISPDTHFTEKSEFEQLPAGFSIMGVGPKGESEVLIKIGEGSAKWAVADSEFSVGSHILAMQAKEEGWTYKPHVISATDEDESEDNAPSGLTASDLQQKYVGTIVKDGVDGEIWTKKNENYWSTAEGSAISDVTLAGLNPELVKDADTAPMKPFDKADLAQAKKGFTVYNPSNGSYYTKNDDYYWTEYKGGVNWTDYHILSSFTNMDTLLQFDVDGDAPAEGKYTSAGKVFMYVKPDGTGVYEAKDKTTKKLTAAAVKKNLAAGMSNYVAFEKAPDVIAPEAGVKKTVSKTKTPLGDVVLEDGTYFLSNSESWNATKYEVADGKVKIYPKGEDKGNEPVSLNKLKTSYFGGKIVDKDGNSVVPENYNGPLIFNNTPTSVQGLVAAQKILEEDEFTSLFPGYGTKHFPSQKYMQEMKTAGFIVEPNAYYTKWYNQQKAKDPEFPFTYTYQLTWDQNQDNAAHEGTLNLLKEDIAKALEGKDTSVPESNASALFEWGADQEAIFPAEVAAHQYSNWESSSLTAHAKLISNAIGGGKILQTVGMDKYTKNNWISKFNAGDFKAMYLLEVQSLANKGKAHPAGYLHPGYEGNEETNKVIWGAAVAGEVPATKEVPGNWSAVNVQWSAPELDNYLIAAHMQNPEYLTLAQKRTWVKSHLQKNKPVVDELSINAQKAKEAGAAPNSEKPVWTDDIVPAKSYDYWFDEGPYPSAGTISASPYDQTQSWAADNWDNAEFQEHLKEVNAQAAVSKDNLSNYTYDTETAVAKYFGAKKKEYDEELKKPVYSLVKVIDAGSHEVLLVKDQFDRQSIFKPSEEGREYRSEMEAAANQLSGLFGFKTPKASIISFSEAENGKKYFDDSLAQWEGKSGLLQTYTTNVGHFGNAANGEPLQMHGLTDKQLGQVAAEHVLDWILDNDDTHEENLLLDANGNAVGIDKGRGLFVYGNWDGLSTTDTAHTNATLVYTQLYNDIRSGAVTKEQADAAYKAAMTSAKRISKASDLAITNIILEGAKNRTDWRPPGYMTHFNHEQAPTNPQELVDAVLARKANLPDQIQEMWAKLYKDAGYELPQPPKKALGETHLSGWEEDDLKEKIDGAKVWGAAPVHSSPSVAHGSSLLWTEEKSGVTQYSGQMNVGRLMQKKFLKFLSSKAGSTEGMPMSQSNSISGFPSTVGWKKAITTAGKDISSNAVSKEFNEKMWTDLLDVNGQIDADLEFWKPDLTEGTSVDFATFPSGNKVPEDGLLQYKQLLDSYKEMISKVQTAKEAGEATNKDDFKSFVPVPIKKDPEIITGPDGVVYTQLLNGSYIVNDGKNVTVSAQKPQGYVDGEEGWESNKNVKIVDTDPVSYKKLSAGQFEGQLGNDGLKTVTENYSGSGHHGTQYQITLPTGEIINFRDSGDTSTAKSQNGLLSFTLAPNVDPASSLQRVQDQLESLGLSMEGADETDAETLYWREMFDRVIFSNSVGKPKIKEAAKKLSDLNTSELRQKVADALDLEVSDVQIEDRNLIEAIGLSMSKEEEHQFWHDLAVETYGEEEVEAWIASENHLPQYQHMDLKDVTKSTGKPFFKRIDVDSKALKSKKALIAIGNNGKDNSLLNYIKSGGMISTEERLRILGFFKDGASSSADQGTGGAQNIFTRLAIEGASVEKQGAIYGSHVAYWSPDVLQMAGTYSFGSDQYGEIDNQKHSNQYDPLDSLSTHHGTGNETMVPNTMSIYDYLEIMVFEDFEKRNKAIQELKEMGLEILRGLPIEDRLVMRKDLNEALKKVKEAWDKQ